jgi:ankyrin repeat protein
LLCDLLDPPVPIFTGLTFLINRLRHPSYSLTGKVKVDLNDQDGGTPLLWAAEGRHKAVVKLLLRTGKVEVDSKGRDGRTLLS